MKKIILVIGTRPEAIKLIPVYIELKKSDLFDVVIVSTGQHKEMLTQIFSFFGVQPEIELNLMTHNQSLAQITALLFTHLDKVIGEVKPHLVVVQGDTTTAMVAAMVGFYHQIKVAHIEAGLRSFNKLAPFPEEINRKVISQVADFHFTPTQQSYNNLINESAGNIHLVGNTVIDSLLLAKDKVEKDAERYQSKYADIIHFERKIILITAHRRESFGNGLQNICKAIQTLSLRYEELEFVFPVHLNPNIKAPVEELLGKISNVHLLPPVQYDDMIFLMSRSHIILTDSGGVQEEAPSFHVPLIVLRDVTERPEGLEAGCSVIGGTDTARIIDVFSRVYTEKAVYDNMRNKSNPYGDGMASGRFAEIIKDYI